MRDTLILPEHHGQRIAHAIVMTDALNICAGITKLKKRATSRADRPRTPSGAA